MSIVSAFGLTHTPGLGDRLDSPPADQIKRIMDAFGEVRAQIAAARPEVMIALINDHFDMFTLDNMPAFAVSVAPVHHGPPADSEAWIKLKRREIPGHEDFARAILAQAMADGIELHRAGPAEFVHNALIPLRYLRPEMDIPVVPVFTNCFVPPLPRLDRAYALGESIRRVIEARPERVCVFASGGLSHWPPYPQEGQPLRDDLDEAMMVVFREGTAARTRFPHIRAWVHEREAEMAATMPNLINADWDRAMLNAMAKGDAEAILRQDFAAIEATAGMGGWEIAMWVQLMAVMGRKPGRIVGYEPVKEWMGGVATFSYF